MRLWLLQVMPHIEVVFTLGYIANRKLKLTSQRDVARGMQKVPIMLSHFFSHSSCRSNSKYYIVSRKNPFSPSLNDHLGYIYLIIIIKWQLIVHAVQNTWSFSNKVAQFHCFQYCVLNGNYVTMFLIGIFFKYDMSSIMVRVENRHRSFWGFLVRLCGIVGGIFATSGEFWQFPFFI